MADDTSETMQPGSGAATAARPLSEAARRALAEAAERARQRAAEPPRPAEIHGRNGPEPTRYGDWERKGILSDF